MFKLFIKDLQALGWIIAGVCVMICIVVIVIVCGAAPFYMSGIKDIWMLSPWLFPTALYVLILHDRAKPVTCTMTKLELPEKEQ